MKTCVKTFNENLSLGNLLCFATVCGSYPLVRCSYIDICMLCNYAHIWGDFVANTLYFLVCENEQDIDDKNAI